MKPSRMLMHYLIYYSLFLLIALYFSVLWFITQN